MSIVYTVIGLFLANVAARMTDDHQLGNELFHLVLLSNAEFVPDTPKRSSGKWDRRIHPQFVPNFLHNWVTAFTIYSIIPV